MKHAFLIITHGSYPIYELLLKAIDHPNCDIFVHVDKKVSKTEFNNFSNVPLDFSRLFILPCRHDVKWGGYSQIDTEMSLFEFAYNNANYDYYHLLSGVDMLIKPINKVLKFFEDNNGYEFLGASNATQSFYNRVAFYHFIVPKGDFAKKISALSVRVQKLLKVNRISIKELYYGNNWGSFTNKFIMILLSNKAYIRKHFKYSFCADELYKQTIMKKYGHFHDKGSCRMIDWKKGSPYVYTEDDYEEIVSSKYMFCRKFSVENFSIVSKLYDFLVQDN